MLTKSVAELSRALQSKEISSVELTKAYLSKIKEKDSQLNAYITVCEEIALNQAQRADELISKGQGGALAGIPIAQKDIFCTEGVKTSCGSKMLDNFEAPYNATVVEQFYKANTVLLGKTNMDEFAMGSSNETSFYGPVKNPWNTETVPGGSSGGSAAAVAAGLAPAATGTDTGGSIRQPAALCGITGIKPTYGRVSRYGMIAFASSLDQGGLLTRTAEDAALLLSVMAGYDERDSTSIEQPVPNYSVALNESVKGKVIGVPSIYFEQGLDPLVANVVNTAIKEFISLGLTIKEIELPNTHLSVPAYYVIAPAECSSNLSRYDGVRFGYRCDKPQDLLDLYTRSRGEGFGSEVKRRIMIGTYALSSGYYDAYYLKAQKVRQLIRQDFLKAFEEVDFVMGPTTPSTAFELGAKADDPISMYLSDIYTIAVNLAGLPAMSVPCGFVNQMPVGLQIISNYFTEGSLLNIAHQYQQVTDWHKKVPEGCE